MERELPLFDALLLLGMFAVCGFFFAKKLWNWLFANSTFTNDEWEAFEKAERVRKDLDKAKEHVAGGKPDYSVTMGLSKKK